MILDPESQNTDKGVEDNYPLYETPSNTYVVTPPWAMAWPSKNAEVEKIVANFMVELRRQVSVVFKKLNLREKCPSFYTYSSPLLE